MKRLINIFELFDSNGAIVACMRKGWNIASPGIAKDVSHARAIASRLGLSGAQHRQIVVVVA